MTVYYLLQTISGKKVISLKLLKNGEIDHLFFDKVIDDIRGSGNKILASIMKVNNETGRIKDLSHISMRLKEVGGFLHSDAVQAFGKIPFEDWSWQTDALTIAAHKVGGPKGIGVLILKDNIVLQSLISGGGQEMRRRAGTENIPYIIAFSQMIDLMPQMYEEAETYITLRNAMINFVKNENYQSEVACSDMLCISNTLSIMSPQMSSEKQVILADLSGIALSGGSACSSGKVKQSHVLSSYGYDLKYSSSNIRISLGFLSKKSELEKFYAFYTLVS